MSFLLVVELTPGITIFEKSKLVRIGLIFGGLKAVLLGLFKFITLLVNPDFFFLFVHWFYLFLIATVVNPFFIFISLSWVIKLLAWGVLLILDLWDIKGSSLDEVGGSV